MTISSISIREALGRDDLATVRQLFLEYAAWLNVDLCFQGFEKELATLPGAYASPSGRLFLAEDMADGTRAAGCVGLRRLSNDPTGRACELKRLWVRPEYRGRGAGRELTETALGAARDIGYSLIRLDTLPEIMPGAVAMYRALGFTDCIAYYHNPIAGTVYLERRLEPGST